MRPLPRWLVFVVGGTFRQTAFHGYGWTPSVFRLTHRFFSQGWHRGTTARTLGAAWWEFVTPTRGDADMTTMPFSFGTTSTRGLDMADRALALRLAWELNRARGRKGFLAPIDIYGVLTRCECWPVRSRPAPTNHHGGWVSDPPPMYGPLDPFQHMSGRHFTGQQRDSDR